MQDTSTLLNITVENKIARKVEEVKIYENDIPALIAVINVQKLSVVYLSERGRKILGVTLEELNDIGPGALKRFMSEAGAKEFIFNIRNMLHRNDMNEMITFFQQVRSSPDQSWNWYSSSAKIAMKDDNGLPLLILITAIPVDPQHYAAAKFQRLLNEKNFLLQKYHMFDALTKREIEILKLVAIGCSNEEISKQLFLSKDTVATHRKNIKRKLLLKTSYDFTFFAQAFDLIRIFCFFYLD